ncbi:MULTISPECIES: hypothetical protein [unclassified Streptomyces]|uniref:hypothetical protein n=1 Tax=unclassified Streptomyces TaxID=2593676 RepID=UPI001F0429ED|nr:MULTISPECIES: hypothetical protein [unclassified Streptomyces]MCH0564368.1 hypothetical protein [Streptomyces sp. MUM 2J]MCH0569539.1 hypothetical protein [Streptomyces sp. MUM 136J]
MVEVFDDLNWLITWAYRQREHEAELFEKSLLRFFGREPERRPTLTAISMGSPLWLDLLFHCGALQGIVLLLYVPRKALRLRRDCYEALAETDEAKARIVEARARQVRAKAELDEELQGRVQRLRDNTNGGGFTVYQPGESE